MGKTIPILAMTAKRLHEDMEKSKEAGMDEHLSKPVDIAVLEVNEGVADGCSHIAAALAAHGGDGRHAVSLAGGKQYFLAFHHIHKPHRHANDQCRPQTGFHFLRNGQRAVGALPMARMAPGAPGQRGAWRQRHGWCPPALRLRPQRVCHVADGFTVQFFQARLCDARQRHIGVGNDESTRVQGLDCGFHRAGSKAQIFA